MQLIIAILSNAGGSGKTTLAAHLGYLLSQKNLKVGLIDLDPQGSLALFCGQPHIEVDHSLVSVLKEDFKGNWPFIPCWEQATDKVGLVQGGMGLTHSSNELVLHNRGAYLLADRLTDFPLSHDVLLLDCPATLGPLTLLALTACTHILIPIQMEPKPVEGSAKFLEWYFSNSRQLRLNPIPEVLGFIPNRYDKTQAVSRRILADLPEQLSKMGIATFPFIRKSTEFVNASGAGLPLPLYRPAHKASKDFAPIVEAILGLRK